MLGLCNPCASLSFPNIGVVDALYKGAKTPLCLLTLAHGAGADMYHPFMQALAEALLACNIPTLRYQFPYTQAGRRRPDPTQVLVQTVHAACATACTLGEPVLLGGKSLGGRMSAHALAKDPAVGARALVCFGFPLHPAGKQATTRADILKGVGVPMLLLQGSKDRLADLSLLSPIAAALGATLKVLNDADHGFNVPKRACKTAQDVHRWLAQRVLALAQTLAKP
ncbi:MAG: alpha/beta hydrolase [Deltaproteobacteria bacterium]|nr:MAG: alpha/beta hydrolase [Deltaproteobacteria bacterium]